VWEQNRRRSPSSRGEPVDAWCPTCRALGEEVQLRRNLGRFVRASGASDYESVACPRCLFTALLRR
jgi:hypothetical protein